MAGCHNGGTSSGVSALADSAELNKRSSSAPGGFSRGTNQIGVRLYNERLVLSLIRQHKSLPKADIARLTGLSPQTISLIMN